MIESGCQQERKILISALAPWEALMKQMVWQQLGDIRHQKLLDFGSGKGVTACYYARCNDVVAIEPSAEAISERWQAYPYQQLLGSTEELKNCRMKALILCHNVLEYAEDRAKIVQEFARLLKSDGLLSAVKHNRAGRVMQMAVLLNEFGRAHSGICSKIRKITRRKTGKRGCWSWKCGFLSGRNTGRLLSSIIC